jgi:hypothetical protein
VTSTLKFENVVDLPTINERSVYGKYYFKRCKGMFREICTWAFSPLPPPDFSETIFAIAIVQYIRIRKM